MTTRAFAILAANEPFRPFTFDERALGTEDVAVRIEHCGICHTDLSLARNEWGISKYPLVPGHEITGIVTQIGKNVRELHPGDRVGVGCFVDSGGDDEREPYRPGIVMTYNDQIQTTYGGYAESIVVKSAYVAKIPDALPLDAAAPLLCAGTTMYSPLRHWKIGPGARVGIVGIGGLGHIGIKLARAMGAHVIAFGRSNGKAEDALRMGAHRYVTNPAEVAGQLDLILTTAAADLDWNAYLNALDIDGTLVLVGMPTTPLAISAFPLITGRRRIAGSFMGSMRETRAMLAFCAEHSVVPEIERLPLSAVDTAFARLDRGDVRYRFVLDVSASFATSTSEK